ncbi:hypothetical protein ACO0RG_002913 [Hanseniaspora osmophila]
MSNVGNGLDADEEDANLAQENVDFLDFDVVHTVSLLQGYEWNIELKPEQSLRLRVSSGVAEIFGVELANEASYSFNSQENIAIFSVENCEIEWQSDKNLEISTNKNNYKLKLYSLHFALDKIRSTYLQGPNVVVVGKKNTGKSTMCKTLLSYALKFRDFNPTFINLNSAEGIFTMPGCLTATTVTDLFQAENPQWNESASTTVNSMIPTVQPLVKLFGYESISGNYPLYLLTIQNLSSVVNRKFEKMVELQRSGMIVDTPPLDFETNEFDNEILRVIIESFKITTIVELVDSVTGEEQQSQFLRKTYPQCTIVTLPKDECVVEKPDSYDRFLQRNAIKDYFYGNANNLLSPYTISIKFEDLVVWKPKEYTSVQEAISDQAGVLEMKKVSVSQSTLQHAVLAITFADMLESNPHKIMNSGVMGFGLVTEVSDAKSRLKLLIPIPGQLPRNALVLTQYRYLE